MSDIEALMKRCQIGVPRGPNAYEQLHSILAECYGELGALSARPEPDCRTCANHVACVNTYPERQTCVSGDKYQPLPPMRLWRTT